MKLDLDDYAILSGLIVTARLGGFALTVRVFRKNLQWAQLMVGQLWSYSQWSHGAMRHVLTHLGVNYEPAPALQPRTPPPTSVSWNDFAREFSGPGNPTPAPNKPKKK